MTTPVYSKTADKNIEVIPTVKGNPTRYTYTFIDFQKKLDEIITNIHSERLIGIKFKNMFGEKDYDLNCLNEVIDSRRYVMIYKNECAVVYTNSEEHLKDNNTSNKLLTGMCLVMVNNFKGDAIPMLLTDINDYFLLQNNGHSSTVTIDKDRDIKYDGRSIVIL